MAVPKGPKKVADLSGNCGNGQIWDPKAGKCIDASKLPGGPILTKKKRKRKKGFKSWV
jgi:hypothetical protein